MVGKNFTAAVKLKARHIMSLATLFTYAWDATYHFSLVFISLVEVHILQNYSQFDVNIHATSASCKVTDTSPSFLNVYVPVYALFVAVLF